MNNKYRVFFDGQDFINYYEGNDFAEAILIANDVKGRHPEMALSFVMDGKEIVLK